MKIIIDLDGATPEQKGKFSEGTLPETLTALRVAVGDATANIEVQQAGGGMRLHVVQTLDDFNEYPSEAMQTLYAAGQFNPLKDNMALGHDAHWTERTPMPTTTITRPDGWHWVRKKGWGEKYGEWIPAEWKQEFRSWASTRFSGIPDSEMIVGGRLEHSGQ